LAGAVHAQSLSGVSIGEPAAEALK
jgi:hypothetical protein